MKRFNALIFSATLAVALPSVAAAQNASAPATLQLFDASYATLEKRSVDLHAAGYGGVWLPPPGRADSGDHSVGYDVYDRFDLGSADRHTLYGTQLGLKNSIAATHRFGGSVYSDLIWNHNGFSDRGTFGFVTAGDYPGFVTTAPGTTDGDFHSAFAGGVYDGRLSGLIDIDQGLNLQYIRSPVPGFANNIPAGTTPRFGRLADVPSESNRALYPDQQGGQRNLFDPTTGTSFTRYDFTLANPMAGDPVSENATGYLMRQAQWMVQNIGVDGFRIDAAKHFEPWVLNYLDRAVYQASNRTLLNGQKADVYSFSEALDTNFGLLQSYTRKDINPADPGRVGGNRDVLDFPLFYAMRENLSGNGLQNDWRSVINASFDVNDDGLANNGSQGMAFVQSHDDFGPQLTNVAHAFVLMRPGNAVVYLNASEFGDRDFPKDGRGDALGGQYGDTITTLTNLRLTHGRGNFISRLTEKETLIYERENSALVVLSNRLDGGYDSRTVATGFAPGTPLVELTGNANLNGDIPGLVVVNSDGTVNLRALRNNGADHGYLVYGLATPQGQLTLGGTSGVIAGGTATPATNGSTRVNDWKVVTGDSFTVNLQTNPVNLLGFYRDVDADGDNALVRLNEGLDLNGNGVVDNVNPGSVAYGFERFGTKSSPLYTGGDGQFIQTVDTTGLAEGVHNIEVRAFRHRESGPAVFSRWTQAVYVDRLPPEVAFGEVRNLAGSSRQVRIRSTDMTADNVHALINLAPNVSESTVYGLVSGSNQAGQIDRDLFAFGYNNLISGNHVLTVVAYEPSGNKSITRIPGVYINTGIGRGLGDLNGNNGFAANDVTGTPSAFEAVLYARGDRFNPAGDIDADGDLDTADLWQLRGIYQANNATAAIAAARAAEITRGNVNQFGGTDAADIDTVFRRFGPVGNPVTNTAGWYADLNADGTVSLADVDTILAEVFETFYGDANLDGVVDVSDLGVIASNFRGTGSTIGWARGDFTGDGLVDVADLGLLASNFRAGTAAALSAIAAFNLPLPSVPEPASAAVVIIGLSLLHRRPARCSTCEETHA